MVAVGAAAAAVVFLGEASAPGAVNVQGFVGLALVADGKVMTWSVVEGGVPTGVARERIRAVGQATVMVVALGRGAAGLAPVEVAPMEEAPVEVGPASTSSKALLAVGMATTAALAIKGANATTPISESADEAERRTALFTDRIHERMVSDGPIQNGPGAAAAERQCLVPSRRPSAILVTHSYLIPAA